MRFFGKVQIQTHLMLLFIRENTTISYMFYGKKRNNRFKMERIVKIMTSLIYLG